MGFHNFKLQNGSAAAAATTASESRQTCSPDAATPDRRRGPLMTNEPQPIIRQSPDPAPLPREATQSLSGLEQVRAMRDGILGLAPMQALMNMRLIEAEDGLVVFTAVPEEKHYNPQGTVHGAFATAILNSAMGLAVVTKLPAGIGQTTVEFKLSFIRPMSAADRRGPRRGPRDPLRPVDRDGGRTPAGTRRQADRPRDHDVPDLPVAAGGIGRSPCRRRLTPRPPSTDRGTALPGRV